MNNSLHEVISGLKEYNKHYFITSVLFSIGTHIISAVQNKNSSSEKRIYRAFLYTRNA